MECVTAESRMCANASMFNIAASRRSIPPVPIPRYPPCTQDGGAFQVTGGRIIIRSSTLNMSVATQVSRPTLPLP